MFSKEPNTEREWPDFVIWLWMEPDIANYKAKAEGRRSQKNASAFFSHWKYRASRTAANFRSLVSNLRPLALVSLCSSVLLRQDSNSRHHDLQAFVVFLWVQLMFTLFPIKAFEWTNFAFWKRNFHWLLALIFTLPDRLVFVFDLKWLTLLEKNLSCTTGLMRQQ